MNNLSLTRKFALISLNGERVKNTTAFNSLKERCMVTSLLLDLIVNKKILSANLMEIDHVLYELVPDAVRVRSINIHGVRLRRHVM